MADISKVTVGGTTYGLKDPVARTNGTPVNPVHLPLHLEKGGVRYVLDVVDDACGIDLVVSRTSEAGPVSPLPLFVTDGTRLYKIDITDDAQGIDLNITKVQ